MNPIIHHTGDDHVVYELGERDLERMRDVELCQGEADATEIVQHRRMCVMQMVSMLTHDAGRKYDAEVQRRYELYLDDGGEWEDAFHGLSDHPVCVSETITDYMIQINDGCTDKERGKLKSVVLDIVSTCPVVKEEGREARDRTPEYRRLESERQQILYSDDFSFQNWSLDDHLEAVRRAARVR